MPKFRTLKQVDFKNKRALLRVDLNIPLGENLKVDKNEKWRIEAIVPTLKYLIKQKAKIILISHLGRPDGRKNLKFSLKPVAQELRKILRKKIIFSDEIINRNVGKKIEEMKFGDILMLENIRFLLGEEKNSPRLARELVKLGDIFINEAFANSHRKHASMVGIAEHLPSVAGFLFQKELEELNKILKKPKHPLIAIIGGAKISTKIRVINKFLKIADQVLIGGALANTIFASQGYFMANSVVEKKAFSEIRKINLKNSKLFLPNDLVALNKEVVRHHEIDEIEKSEKVYDIGPKTIYSFCDLIEKAKMIVWNGPLGFYTQKPFDKSSKIITEAIAESKAYSIAGGGDTVAFIKQIEKEKAFDHLSTGGGAMLDYLAFETLPGLEVLEK